ncbi:MAG TPA: ParA family protein [Limnochordales bacterium]
MAVGRVIAVANQKGGVAKTTTVANLAAALSQLGARVLMLDMDPQGSLTLWSGRNPDTLEKSLYDSLVKGLDSRQIRLSTPLGADLLPANVDLSLAEMELVGMVARERRLGAVLAPVRDEYDFVLVDCQPSLGLLTINALAAADELLIPVACEFLSTRAIQVLLRMVRKVQLRLNSKLAVTGILPTLYDRRVRHARDELEALVEQFGAETPVLVDCAVPRSIRFAEAAAAGKSILAFAPLHPGAEAYRRLARFVAGDALVDKVPAAASDFSLLDIEEPRIDVLVRKDTPVRSRR